MSSGWMCYWQTRSVADPVVIMEGAKHLHSEASPFPGTVGPIGLWGWLWSSGLECDAGTLSLQGFLALSLEPLIPRPP